MRECSLHFDFSNAEGKLDLNKAEALMEMALKLGIHTFNTYWDQEVYPEKDAEDQEFADQIHALGCPERHEAVVLSFRRFSAG